MCVTLWKEVAFSNWKIKCLPSSSSGIKQSVLKTCQVWECEAQQVWASHWKEHFECRRWRRQKHSMTMGLACWNLKSEGHHSFVQMFNRLPWHKAIFHTNRILSFPKSADCENEGLAVMRWKMKRCSHFGKSSSNNVNSMARVFWVFDCLWQ